MPTLDTGVLFMDSPADLLPISWLTGNGHGDNRPSLMSQGPERGGPSGGPPPELIDFCRPRSDGVARG
jgi:hypothetical protein